MKINQLHKEMLEVAKQIGIPIRRESGSFKSGFCILNNQEVIILNKSTTIETMTSVLAQCLSKYSGQIFLKPVVREFIEKEIPENLFNLEIKY